MSQPPADPARYQGPERRTAFFPRRLRNVPAEALLVGANGDRRNGYGRRAGDGYSKACQADR